MLHQEAEHVVVDYIKLLQIRITSDESQPGDDKCLLRVISYLVNIIRDAANDTGNSDDASQSSSVNVNTIPSSSGNIHSVALIDWIHDSDLIHLIFTLKALNHFISGWGSVTISRKMILK